jgi:hypothetical protein
MTSVFVLFPMVIASLALRAEMVLAAAVPVVTGDAPGIAHPATQAQNANATPT